MTAGPRVAISLARVLVPLIAGYHGRSPWLLVGLLPFFAASHALGRAGVWRPLLREGLSARLVAIVLSTLSVQFVLISLFYLVGLGLGSLFGEPLPLRSFTSGDAVAIALFALVSIGGGLLAIRQVR